MRKARARSTLRCTHRPRREPVSGDGFRELRALAAFDRRTTAAVLGVTERTIRNWEASRARAPYSALELLRVLGCYGLPGSAWAGWCLRGDALWSPEQRSFRPHEMAWWGLTVAMAREWKRWRDVQAANGATVEPVPASHVVAQLTITAGDFDLDTCEGLTASGEELDVKSGHGSAAGCGIDAVPCRGYSLTAKPLFDHGLAEFDLTVSKSKGGPRDRGAPAPRSESAINLCNGHITDNNEK